MDKRIRLIHMDSARSHDGRNAKEVLDEFYRGSKTLRVQGHNDGVTAPSFKLMEYNESFIYDV